MEDKTPIYVIMIVGIVAVVAIVYMLLGSGGSAPSTGSSATLTGNVVSSVPPVNYTGGWAIFFGVVLLGIALYTYHTNE